MLKMDLKEMNKTELKRRITNLNKLEKEEHNPYRQNNIDKFKNQLKKMELQQ